MSITENSKEQFLGKQDDSLLISDEAAKDVVIEKEISKELSKIVEPNLQANFKKDTTIYDINLQSELRFISKPYVNINGNEVNLYITFSLNEKYLTNTSFFIHYGSYDDVPENWESIQISKNDIIKNDEQNYTIQTKWIIPCKGNFGATVYATYPNNEKPVWQGTQNDDAKIKIDNDCFFTIEKILKSRTSFQKETKELLKNGIKTYSSFKDLIVKLKKESNQKYLSEIIYNETKGNKDLRDTLTKYYKDAKKEYYSKNNYQTISSAKELIDTLDTLGLRETAFVAPEGPHASGGGLAEVMKGLLKALSQKGMKVSLISPLYEYDQGGKHSSAEHTLKAGIKFGNYILKPKYAGEVLIPFGKTTHVQHGGTIDNAFHQRATVHIAKQGNFTLVLLRCKRFADYLYARINADEQLRRAIFLSRGALEVINNPLFDINPQIIVSNDWQAGLIPPLLKLDGRYANSLAFCNCKTVHMIHNCGRDYHGNIPVNCGGKNLYSMLELDSCHIYGLTHPSNNGILNLTAGAIRHLNGVLSTVSKPYSQELLDWNKGEGLTDLIKAKPGALVGISNGIDQNAIRRKVISLGTNEFEDMISPEDDNAYYSKIISFKSRIKEKLQKDFNLQVNQDAKLFSFIGRIAEQKGIELMYNRPAGENVSVIEAILMHYPESQFIFAGPYTDGDIHARNLRNCVEYLSQKYPNRIKGIYEFVSHDFAIEIHAGSDFFMMPSRYEPGGIVQLEAIACGTLVIGRNVGGISATLRNYGDLSKESNAFMFDTYTSDAFYRACCYALNTVKDSKLNKTLILQATRAKHDWGHRVSNYISLFQYILGVLNPYEFYDYLENHRKLIEESRTY
ncbi:MAG: glycogen/starch synthase [Bdellovibrionota bacterium]